MPNDPKITNVFSVRELITMPLEAVIDANISASEASIKFIREYGFEHTHASTDEWGELRMVTFRYSFVASGTRNDLEVRLPLLSLIPLPLLTIDRASFEIGMHVLHHIVDPQDAVGGPGSGASPPIEPPTQLPRTLGMLAPVGGEAPPATGESFTPYSYSRLQANILAKIEVVSSDLPPGILSLLNLLQGAGESVNAGRLAIGAVPQRLLYEGFPVPTPVVLTVTSPDDQARTVGVPLKVEVSSSTGAPLDAIFAGPIELQSGLLVGRATRRSVTALTDDTGQVVVQLSPRPLVQDNGFVRVTTSDAAPCSVYYQLAGGIVGRPPPDLPVPTDDPASPVHPAIPDPPGHS